MRYIIGIDLGTTNSSLAFVDTAGPSLAIQHFSIAQLISAGQIDYLSTLPSFCYLISGEEWAPNALKLPWKKETVLLAGELAKIQGSRIPTRLVQSAKSWLSHVAANRRDKILPVDAADISLRISPVEASAKYLIHLKEAWNHVMAKSDPLLVLEEQEIILTVPASFDETARNLTIEAAKLAGFRHLTLIEEPLAAFYSWIAQHEESWKTSFKAGETVLVCDVGGGTTDFSLIEIQEKNGNLTFQRMAVGDHLLLGGDNMDTTLAHYLENKIEQERHVSLDSSQWLQLVAESRQAKETLLKKDASNLSEYALVIQGSGSSVIKNSITLTVHRSEIDDLLVKGFFSVYPLNEALMIKKTVGLRTMGLPYEEEPSVTKHLAHFLKQAHYFENNRSIHYVLFNGGVFKSPPFQTSILQSLRTWYSNDTIECLTSYSLDVAVSRGAAYFGKARKGCGVKIIAGVPRTYYLSVQCKSEKGETVEKALTILPKGTLEGQTFQSNHLFSLRANQPVAFHLLSSHTRLNDQKEDLISIDSNELHKLPTVETILRFGQKQPGDNDQTIPVKLSVKYTELGTLEIWLESQKSNHRWNLEFQLRSATGQDTVSQNNGSDTATPNQLFEEGFLDKSKEIITALFAPQSSLKPSQIMELLEKSIDLPRKEWGPAILRSLWSTLLEMAPKRKINADLESRWWNLAGFFLRPGIGSSLDDFRIKDIWKVILSDIKVPKTSEITIQMAICLRRIAAGLNKGQQMQAAAELLSAIIDKKKDVITVKHSSEIYLYVEKMRALASFENIDIPLKIRLGNALVTRILNKQAHLSDFWSLGRIGARHLLYGSAGSVVPKEIVTSWLKRLLDYQPQKNELEPFLFLIQQLGRKVSNRELNIAPDIAQKIIEKFPSKELEKALLEVHSISGIEQDRIFGEALPIGLILESHLD